MSRRLSVSAPVSGQALETLPSRSRPHRHFARRQTLSLTLLLLTTAVAARAEVAVTGYELLSNTRSGRTNYDYTYRVRIASNGPPLTGVLLTVTSNSPATTILDGFVEVGYLAEGAQTESVGTFTFRQDRTKPFDKSALAWQVEGQPLSYGSDAPELVSVEFIEPNDVSGYAPWVVVGNPGSGQLATLILNLDGVISSGHVELVDLASDVVASAPLVPLTETESISTDDRQGSTFQPPSSEFA